MPLTLLKGNTFIVGVRPDSLKQPTVDEQCRRHVDALAAGLMQHTWDTHFQVYGVRKLWRQLQRDGYPVARCTVHRVDAVERRHDLGAVRL